METLEILQTTWFFILGIVFIGYSILDGFDLGIGCLIPFISKNDDDTGLLIRTIGPVWDGNEVWLLLAGGATFAAFPHVYATVFSGFYLAFMLILFGLIFRAVSIEFWSLDDTSKRMWRNALAAGSFLPSLLFGVALGNVIQGIPMDKNMDFSGNILTLLRPFPLSTGLLGLAAILMQGVTYACLKTGGEIRNRAKSILGKIWIFYLTSFALHLGGAAVFADSTLSNPLAWIFTIIVIISLVLIRYYSGKDNDLMAFISSSAAFTGLWGIAGSVQYPILVRGTPESSLNLTIYNSSSTELTLTVLLVVALTGMPIVIAYTFYIYRIFRGKVN